MHGARSGCDADVGRLGELSVAEWHRWWSGDGWVVLVLGEEDVGFVREGVGSWWN